MQNNYVFLKTFNKVSEPLYISVAVRYFTVVKIVVLVIGFGIIEFRSPGNGGSHLEAFGFEKVY